MADSATQTGSTEQKNSGKSALFLFYTVIWQHAFYNVYWMDAVGLRGPMIFYQVRSSDCEVEILKSQLATKYDMTNDYRSDF